MGSLRVWDPFPLRLFDRKIGSDERTRAPCLGGIPLFGAPFPLRWFHQQKWGATRAPCFRADPPCVGDPFPAPPGPTTDVGGAHARARAPCHRGSSLFGGPPKNPFGSLPLHPFGGAPFWGSSLLGPPKIPFGGAPFWGSSLSWGSSLYTLGAPPGGRPACQATASAHRSPNNRVTIFQRQAESNAWGWCGARLPNGVNEDAHAETMHPGASVGSRSAHRHRSRTLQSGPFFNSNTVILDRSNMTRINVYKVKGPHWSTRLGSIRTNSQEGRQAI